MTVLFVDDDALVLRSVRRALAHDKRFEVRIAQGGSEGLRCLEAEPVSIVVSDVRMPEMDGVAFLKEVKRRHSAVLRLALSGYADTRSMMGLTSVAHRYLSKPIDPKELGSVLGSMALLTEGIGSPDVLSVVESAVPGIHRGTASEVLVALENTDFDPDELVELIQRDTVLTSKVLQLANSPLFGSRCPVSELRPAIMTVGTNILKPLVLMLSATATDEDRGSDLPRRMQHGLNVAQLAHRVCTGRKELAQTAGLLHDIGCCVIENIDREQTEVPLSVLDTATGPAIQATVDGRTVEASHAEVGAVLLALWGISAEVASVVRHHHSVATAPDTIAAETLAVHVADALLSYGDWPSELDLAYLDARGLTDQIPIWEQEIRDLFATPRE